MEKPRPTDQITTEQQIRLDLTRSFSKIVRKTARKAEDVWNSGNGEFHATIELGMTHLFYKRDWDFTDKDNNKTEKFVIHLTSDYFGNHGQLTTFRAEPNGQIQRSIGVIEGMASLDGMGPVSARLLSLDEMKNLIKFMKSPHMNSGLIEGLIKPSLEEKEAIGSERKRLREIQERLDKTLGRDHHTGIIDELEYDPVLDEPLGRN